MPNFEQSLSALVELSSISSTNACWDQTNKPVIDLLANWFDYLGFSVDISLVPDSRNKYNILAKLGSGEGGLLLAGHSDTVPYDESGWLSDPFSIKQKDGRFYGLGTCDMKGFFACIMQVCRNLSVTDLTKPLYVLVTADEETSMAGARFFSKSQTIRPDVAVIGEPTELTPVIMHKGHMSHRITVLGKSGHSSQPAGGVNAIEIMHHIISKLLKLKRQLALNYSNQAFDVQEPTLNFGAIRGGDSPNRVCGHCELDIDLRALPGMKDEELLYWLSESSKDIANQYVGRIKFDEIDPSAPSFEQNKDSDVVLFTEKLSGHNCCAVNYATEAPFIQKLSGQTIVFGPGSISQAHQPNEFLAEDQISKTLNILTQMIQRYCITINDKT